jgi:hypothetical protein
VSQVDTARRPVTGRAAEPPSLRLLGEAKIADLLGGAASGVHRLEASGVLAAGGWYWVVFDNVPHVARIHPEMTPGHPGTTLLRKPGGPIGFEDIAHDGDDGRFFVLIEATAFAPGVYQAEVCEFDRGLRLVARRWLDFPLEDANKGMEGLSCVRRQGHLHLLGLCEGNRCHGGEAGRRPGGGRVHVFTEGAKRWERVHTIHLPESLPFIDYSAISVSGDRVAVISQESSALWVGRLSPDGWDILDEGEVYRFPRDPRGRVVYGTVEGVSWLAERLVVVVSDRAKPEQPRRMRAKDESIHVFALPGEDAGAA